MNRVTAHAPYIVGCLGTGHAIVVVVSDMLYGRLLGSAVLVFSIGLAVAGWLAMNNTAKRRRTEARK